jgi:hypothetical protein
MLAGFYLFENYLLIKRTTCQRPWFCWFWSRFLAWFWIDPEVYSWFAFGMWIDRIAAQRFGVNSSRMFYQGKLKLNEQF